MGEDHVRTLKVLGAQVRQRLIAGPSGWDRHMRQSRSLRKRRMRLQCRRITAKLQCQQQIHRRPLVANKARHLQQPGGLSQYRDVDRNRIVAAQLAAHCRIWVISLGIMGRSVLANRQYGPVCRLSLPSPHHLRIRSPSAFALRQGLRRSVATIRSRIASIVVVSRVGDSRPSR